MSDPFDVLRGSSVDEVASPDVRAIKARAGQIQRRRSVALVTGAAAVALIAFVGVVVRPGADRTTADLADSVRGATTPAPEALTMDAPAIPDAANDTAVTGDEQRSSGKQAGGDVAKGGSTASIGASSEAEAASSPIALTLEVDERALPRGAEFTLKACNTTDAPVTQEFGSAQRYDFVVRNGDDEVWRWSHDMSFAQVVGEETWKAKGCKSWTESWDGTTKSGAPAQSGTYESEGVLTTTKPQTSDTHIVCLDIC